MRALLYEDECAHCKMNVLTKSLVVLKRGKDKVFDCGRSARLRSFGERCLFIFYRIFNSIQNELIIENLKNNIKKFMFKLVLFFCYFIKNRAKKDHEQQM